MLEEREQRLRVEPARSKQSRTSPTDRIVALGIGRPFHRAPLRFVQRAREANQHLARGDLAAGHDFDAALSPALHRRGRVEERTCRKEDGRRDRDRERAGEGTGVMERPPARKCRQDRGSVGWGAGDGVRSIPRTWFEASGGAAIARCRVLPENRNRVAAVLSILSESVCVSR